MRDAGWDVTDVTKSSPVERITASKRKDLFVGAADELMLLLLLKECKVGCR